MRLVHEAADLTVAESPAPDLRRSSAPSFRLRCSDVHPVRCDVAQGASTPSELVEWACAHGASDHGFTPVWYSPARVASIASAVTG